MFSSTRFACWVFALASLLTACGGGSGSGGDDTSGDDGGGGDGSGSAAPGDFHNVTFNWHLKNNDGTAMAACPAGFDKLIFRMYKDGYVEPPGSIERKPCTPSGTLTKSIPTSGVVESTTEPGSYYDFETKKDFDIELTEETEEVYAAKTDWYRTELTADLTMDFDIYPAGGYGVASWELRSMNTGAALISCAAAGVDEIEYAVRPFTDDQAPLVVGGSWPCDHKDPYFKYSPGGNFPIPDDEEHDLGVGHTKGYAPLSYYVELRAKRAGVVVGKSESSMNISDGNTSDRIHDDFMIITDR